MLRVAIDDERRLETEICGSCGREGRGVMSVPASMDGRKTRLPVGQGHGKGGSGTRGHYITDDASLSFVRWHSFPRLQMAPPGRGFQFSLFLISEVSAPSAANTVILNVAGPCPIFTSDLFPSIKDEAGDTHLKRPNRHTSDFVTQSKMGRNSHSIESQDAVLQY